MTTTCLHSLHMMQVNTMLLFRNTETPVSQLTCMLRKKTTNYSVTGTVKLEQIVAQLRIHELFVCINTLHVSVVKLPRSR